MRQRFNRRLFRLENNSALSAVAAADEADHEAVWLRIFDEFGVPAETPIPNHMPIIREGIDHDGSVAFRVLRVGGTSIPHPCSTLGTGTQS